MAGRPVIGSISEVPIAVECTTIPRSRLTTDKEVMCTTYECGECIYFHWSVTLVQCSYKKPA